MKIKVTAHIYFSKYSWENNGEFLLFYAKIEGNENMVYVSTQEVEVEVPENFDPRALQIAALEAQKQKAMADFQKSVDDINERISKLQAITYTA